MIENLHKLKLQSSDLYLLALRQILLNQSELLVSRGYNYKFANDSKDLSSRIEEFIENKQ